VIEPLQVEITRIDESLPLPMPATAGAAGFDLYCRSTIVVAPGSIELVPSNVIVKVPDGHVLIVVLRSSTPRRKGLIMPNGIGVIDSDYCGPHDEVQIQVLNLGNEQVTVERGERVAQGILLPLPSWEWSEVDASERADRGGFGSTG
jgi:dUTP pyrophosphatase